MNIIIKRFLAFILSFALIFSSTSALAASPVGWSASPADIIMNGATATINAVKGSGSSALQATIKHAPTAANVGKKLIRGGGAAALLIAVPQILGEGIDWVLDPANNRIIYTEGGDGEQITPATPLIWKAPPAKDYIYATPQAAARVVCQYHNQSYGAPYKIADSIWYVPCKRANGSTDTWDVQSIPNPAFDPSIPNPEPEKKYLPISTVAAKVVANAASGEPNSQELLKTVAIDDVNSGALDVPLNIAAVPKADAPAVPDPDAPPVDPDAPPVPFDPSSIISAIKSVMAAVVNMSGVLGAKFDALMVEMGLQNDKTIEAIETAEAARAADAQAAKEAADAKAAADAEFQEWVKEEAPPLDDDTELDIPVPDVVPVDTDINFGGSCPANFEVNSSIFGNPINITLFETSKFCSFLSTFVKFPVYAASSLFALYILGGRKDV